MKQQQMTLSEELEWRGFIKESTFADIKELDKKKQWVFYHGFDASAESQTIGNLAAMMFDKVFMRHGHKAIILAGGATSLIGDPGGKEVERNLQAEKIINNNVKNAEVQLQAIFKDHKFTMVNNIEWTKSMSVLDFLRDIGKHFSMTNLVQRDYIATRMNEGGSGISYTEFSYTLLQGMDYLHLFDKYDCTLQLGGSDQWGNCLSGVDLIRRARGVETHVITLPLVINKATGKKFGKSEEGAVWLDAKNTSVYKFYQFWLNMDDEGVEDYLKVYTELNKNEVDNIISEFNKDKSKRHAQKVLAKEVTEIVHGKEITKKIINITELLFEGNYKKLKDSDFELLTKELPTETVKNKSIVELLVAGGLASSNTEAKRFIAGGAIYINGTQIDESKNNLDKSDFISGYAIMRRGKNNQMIVKN